MDQTVFNVAIGLSSFLGGWMLKIIWEGLQELRKSTTQQASDLSDVKVLLAGDYVSRDRFEAALASMAASQAAFQGAVFSKLDRIEDKLERKADK